MKDILVLLMACCQFFVAHAQLITKETLDIIDEHNLYINDSTSTDLHYYQILPEEGKPKGVIVVLPSGAERTEDTLKSITLHELAVDNSIMTIIPSINWGTDTMEAEIEFLDFIFKEVIKNHGVSKDKFILGGLSNGGMISLTYAEIAVKNPESTFLLPKGVFALDTPLDETHLYEYYEREIKRNFSEAGMLEAKYFLEEYNENYGGSPQDFPERYIEGSIYSHSEENGGNAEYLKDMPIRMYTDLDVEWLMNERHRDLYDWNGTDIVAMINQLKILGNTDANVKISQGKGVRLDGTRHPHSWSILDTEDCLKWIIDLFNN
ncbi:hypothetical protein [Maribacter sp. 2308TA10-17]|uniref:hypothetical protein n=1 Tax=Maribacter sp. 2308TA10-17 TaxID=3386276 RepID=UPI0039BD7CA9